MTQAQATRKERLKEELTREIDKYYESLTSGLNGWTIKIDDIERMMGEAKAKMTGLVSEATGETITRTEQPVKKNGASPAMGI